MNMLISIVRTKRSREFADNAAKYIVLDKNYSFVARIILFDTAVFYTNFEISIM